MSRPSAPTLSRRALIAGLAATAAGPALAFPPEASIRPAPRPGGATGQPPTVEALLQQAGLSGKTAFVAADAATGEVLETHNPLLPQPPASVAKAITALYALETLGPAFRYRTAVVATGPLQEGRIAGDLVLVGSGDPVLDTNALADLAAGLKAAGVREVAGRFLAWDGALPKLTEIDGTQPDTAGYNPAISGLNLNFNRVHFEWRRAGGRWQVSMDARSDRYRPEVRSARMRVVDRGAPVYTYAAEDGVDRWTVAAGALGTGGSRWLPIRQPAAYAAEVFATFARAHGIALGTAEPAPGPPQGETLAEVESPPLREMAQDMLVYSTNITAEALGLSASFARGGPGPQSLAASAARMSAWLGGRIESAKPALVDHSGLGDGSRLTATDMVRALVRLGPEAGLPRLLKPIPMRDAEYRPIPDSPIAIRAKTGTLHFVSGLAGFVTLDSGRQLAFASFMADTSRRAALAPDDRERPEGSRNWARRARILQLRLIDRWARVYSDAT